ncbi:hypothetical protein [Nocardia otitidiscaviarum]|uniref:hypothetical protein n=1 Tax=Nocardia otitidiscaviarum TaxID=1823 RepID=UPI001E3AFB25|nr:hypothetical protein [Nocardia otitidiscaviarum]
MNTTTRRRLNWPFIFGLGALAMTRPLARIVEDRAGIEFPALTPLLMTLAITVVWIVAVGSSRVREPVLTLVLAGLTYGVLAIVISAVFSPILLGEFAGPLANPIAIPQVLMVNALWGLIAGVLALALQKLTGRTP